MYPCLRLACSVMLLLFGGAAAAQSPAATLTYAGMVGQQRVVLTLEVAEEQVRGGHYLYPGQTHAIGIVDSRQFGSTVVLQDEDGNILHLHFESAEGEKVGSFKAAAMLEGTMDRGELDLPVKLTRGGQQQP